MSTRSRLLPWILAYNSIHELSLLSLATNTVILDNKFCKNPEMLEHVASLKHWSGEGPLPSAISLRQHCSLEWCNSKHGVAFLNDREEFDRQILRMDKFLSRMKVCSPFKLLGLFADILQKETCVSCWTLDYMICLSQQTDSKSKENTISWVAETKQTSVDSLKQIIMLLSNNAIQSQTFQAIPIGHAIFTECDEKLFGFEAFVCIYKHLLRLVISGSRSEPGSVAKSVSSNEKVILQERIQYTTIRGGSRKFFDHYS